MVSEVISNKTGFSRFKRISPGLLFFSMLLFFASGAALVQAKPVSIDRVIAVVNDDVITRSELNSELDFIEKQFRQQNTPLPSQSVLEQQLLDRLIQKRLELQLAEANHIRIDDETLNRTILRIAAQNKLSLTEFRNVLERDGYDFPKYRENIRTEMIISRLRQRQVNNRILVTDQEIDDFLATQQARGNVDDEYKLAHILIEVPEAASPEQIKKARDKAEKLRDELKAGADFTQLAIANSDGQQALQGGDLGWRKLGQLPTLFSGIVTTLHVSDISDLIRSPSGFHIIKLVDKRTSKESHVITQTKVQHILVRTNKLTSNETAVQRLKQLKSRVEHGDDFSELARSHSEDSASAVNGGLLGWVNPGDLDPSFESHMNELKPGQISEPFQTQFGWHIAQVLDRRKYDNTEELKRSKARQQIRQRKIEEDTQTWLRRLREEAYVDIRL
jgi:peptidyl-prolyl cis-trans isomerase SurA